MTSDLSDKLRNLLRDFLVHLVFHETYLEVEAESTANTITLHITCHGEDAPRIIGRAGAHHKALLRIARVIGARSNKRVVLEIDVPRLVSMDHYGAWGFKPDPHWDRKGIVRLLLLTSKLVFGEAEIWSTDDEWQSKTMFSVAVPMSATQELVLSMVIDLNTVFNAIGKRRGRLLQIDVVPELESETVQPKSAKGRFAKEFGR